MPPPSAASMSRPGRRPMPGCCPMRCWPACPTCASRPTGRACWPIRDESRGVFVADDEDMGVVGFGSCGPVRDPPEGLSGREIRVGEVYTLYVEPDFQNRGLGRRLLDALFRQLRADGCDTAVLWMLADNPTPLLLRGAGRRAGGRARRHHGRRRRRGDGLRLARPRGAAGPPQARDGGLSLLGARHSRRSAVDRTAHERHGVARSQQ